MKNPTEETNQFWLNESQKENFDLTGFNQAKTILQSIHIQKKNLSEAEIVSLWTQIEARNAKKKRILYRRNIIRYSTVACILACVLTATLLFTTKRSSVSTDIMAVASRTEIFELPEQISLVLDDRPPLLIEEDNADIQHSASGEIQVNTQKVAESTNLTFNQLIVPYGKRSQLSLSDGSKLWVNAGSRVVYPTVFSKEKREIFIEGEVFLEVDKCKEWPFIVKTNYMDVEALGTSFNVSAYKSDKNRSVVLVSGAVKVAFDNEEVKLKPNNMFVLNDTENSIHTVDVIDHILWKDGLYSFKSQKLSEIVLRLSRFYGKTIECDPISGELVCNGKLDLKEDLERILNGIAQTVPVVWYKENEMYKFKSNK